MDIYRREVPPTCTVRRVFSWIWLFGKVSSSPFSPESIAALNFDVVSDLASQGTSLMPSDEDRKDIPFDYRFLQLLLTAAQDPEVYLGPFASGVRVGPRARLPRLSALYPPKKKWRLLQQMALRLHRARSGHRRSLEAKLLDLGRTCRQSHRSDGRPGEWRASTQAY